MDSYEELYYLSTTYPGPLLFLKLRWKLKGERSVTRSHQAHLTHCSCGIKLQYTVASVAQTFRHVK